MWSEAVGVWFNPDYAQVKGNNPKDYVEYYSTGHNDQDQNEDPPSE